MAGNTRWSVSETDFLKENYGLLPVEEMAVRLGRSVNAVHWQASKAGLRFTRDANFALNEKLDKIISAFDGINFRLDQMEAKINPQPKFFESKEQFVVKNYTTMSRSAMADELGVKVSTVTSIMSRLGLRRYNNLPLPV